MNKIFFKIILISLLSIAYILFSAVLCGWDLFFAQAEDTVNIVAPDVNVSAIVVSKPSPSPPNNYSEIDSLKIIKIEIQDITLNSG